MRASRTERLQSTAALYTVTKLRGKVSAFCANKFPCASVTYLSPAAYRHGTCASHHPGAIVETHTLAVSARLMPVSASPSPRSGRPSRPHLQKAGGLRVGDSYGNRPSRRPIGNVEHPAPAVLSGHALRQQFASSLWAPAGSDDARNAPADNDLPSLAPVADPSDGLPARQLRRPCNAVCLPTCHWQASSTRRPCGAPASSGQQLNPVQLLPTGSVTGAKNGCSRGNQQWWFHCTNREWCPGSLVVLDALRRAGRTETLTGHASHQGHRIRHGNWRNESRRESESGDRSRLEWNRGRHSAPRWQTRCTLPPCCAATTWPGYAARGFSGITSAPWRSLSR